MPASFYGTVTVNGTDAPEGTPVSAWIDGVRYATTDAFTFDGRSMYALDVPADDPATPEVDGGRPGYTIVLRIGGLKADQTATWHGGTNSRLDLTAAGPLVCGREMGCVVFLPLVSLGETQGNRAWSKHGWMAKGSEPSQFGRVPAYAHPAPARINDDLVVHVQRQDRRATNGRQTDHVRP